MNVDETGAAPVRPLVLVVEDDRTLLTVAEAALGAAGFAVDTAADGEAALALLRTSRPDLILLDVLLPGIDGISLCRRLRAEPGTRDTPICIMTGLDDLASIEEAYRAGATDFSSKPLNWFVIVQRLRYLLRAARVARELAASNALLQREMLERERAEAESRKLRQAVDQSANVVIVTDAGGSIEYANPRFEQVTGYSAAEALGRTPRILKSGEHGPEFYADLWGTILAGRVWKGELRNRRKDGTRYWEDTTIAPVFDPAGKLVNFIAIKEDVTARKKLERSERDQRELAEALGATAAALNSSLDLEHVLDSILGCIDRVADFDAAFIAMLEDGGARIVRHRGAPLPRAGVAGTAARLPLRDLPLLARLLENRQPWFVGDVAADPTCASGCHHVPGTRSCLGIPLEIRGSIAGAIVLTSVTPDHFTAESARRLRAFSSQASVAIENARLFQETRRLSVTDGLTGLCNRGHFFDLAGVEFERTRRHARALSAAMVDIDHFKSLNDLLGHLAGDAVLREIARRLKEAVRAIDVVARYGGEEFVVLMPETDLAEALLVAGRVCRSVAQSPVSEGVTAAVTVSVGVAEADGECASLEDLLRRADRALYAAKAAGRNRVEAHPGGGAR